MDAGYQTVPFDASRLASGVYFCRINAQDSEGALANVIEVRKMLLVK
jgi:hypothetical protein